MTIETRQAIGSEVPAARSTTLRRAVGIGLGALCVAVSAQVTVPVSFSPVPMTLQPLAVLAVGGLLGGPRGLAALLTYLALGVLGLPVFAGGSGGIVHLLGPTGGYLLAFPLAACLVGALVGQRSGVLRVLGACALGMLVIH
ncbi:MAG: biotin transporter BioY, partial [Gemmatimonadales bacterium]